MKWGRKSAAEEQKKPKRSNSKNPSPSSSSPTSLLSAVFPFSWISRLKRSNKSQQKANSPPANPKSSAPGGTDRLSSSPRVVDPITGGDAPRRRSTGDDDGRRQTFARDQRDTSKSARHYSLGELELRPISGRRRWDLQPPVPRSPKQQRRITVRMKSPPPLSPLKRIETGRRGQRMRQRVKVSSPRAGRRRGEGEEKGEKRSLERFAVVRRSSDPQKDFRESMLEMIREKGMERPEEMERLLACYITLNADEHHDVIVKAFRQVWFDLGPGRIAGASTAARREASLLGFSLQLGNIQC